MKSLIVIPARYGSTRFPGKPLAPVKGIPMIQRVWAIARAAAGPRGDVLVATDDLRIKEAVEGFGGDAVMTPEACRNGTERVFEAVKARAGADVILNLQGDAVLTPPWVPKAVIDAFAGADDVSMATPAVRLDAEQLGTLRAHKKDNPASGTTVVTDLTGDALYFSKTVLPFARKPDTAAPVWRHIGIYGYRPEVLKRLVALDPSPLEVSEGLEQLRALENGIAIRVAPVDYRGRSHWSVDAPDDVAAAEAIIGREGELLPAYDGSVRDVE